MFATRIVMLDGIGGYLDEIIMIGLPALTFMGIAGYGCWKYMSRNNEHQIRDEYFRNIEERRREEKDST